MSLDVDKVAAMKFLNSSYLKCLHNPVHDCCMKETIDFILHGRNCLTYRYIMFTALVAKAVNEDVDVLSLQAKDDSPGAYDARSLAKEVVYRFQKTMLGDVLKGNSDPLVNKPGRFERLRVSNPATGGDPKTALRMLCDNLPELKSCEDARSCVDYLMSSLIAEHVAMESKRDISNEAIGMTDLPGTRRFLSDLLDQGFGGSALVIVATALCRIMFNDRGFSVIAHPVNQSGSSKRQFSDLDVSAEGYPFLGIELKDKPFTSSDVEHSAELVLKSGARNMLFVAGRHSSFESLPRLYLEEVRTAYANRGMHIGVVSIDALMDIVFASSVGIDVRDVFDAICETAESIGAVEAQMWLYKQLADEKIDK